MKPVWKLARSLGTTCMHVKRLLVNHICSIVHNTVHVYYVESTIRMCQYAESLELFADMSVQHVPTPEMRGSTTPAFCVYPPNKQPVCFCSVNIIAFVSTYLTCRSSD